jgi:hypothetical protein
MEKIKTQCAECQKVHGCIFMVMSLQGGMSEATAFNKVAEKNKENNCTSFKLFTK